ncbi:hypothetical protein [Leeuwenhoekiella sp. NPDC079379]|uniref:hypothetical protein n=1 Tax=Leeuwenhoekiella sp. NPDC079379 TaxID=3364122 RepID=UPI0037C82838
MNLSTYVHKNYIKLSKDEIKDIYNTQELTPTTIETLVKSQLPLALKYATSFAANSNQNLDYCFSIALENLHQSVLKYNPNNKKNASLTSYAIVGLKNALTHFIQFPHDNIIGKKKSNENWGGKTKVKFFSEYQTEDGNYLDTIIEDESTTYSEDYDLLKDLIKKIILQEFTGARYPTEKQTRLYNITIDWFNLNCQDDLSMKDIGKRHNLSRQTINSIVKMVTNKLKENEAFKQALIDWYYE